MEANLACAAEYNCTGQGKLYLLDLLRLNSLEIKK